MIKKIIFICSVILFLSNNLLAKENYTFFGVTLNSTLPDTINLTGELDFGRPLFEPEEKNGRF